MGHSQRHDPIVHSLSKGHQERTTIHTADNVLTHCSRLGIHICLTPGGMTHLCQPLDSHVYATFKKTLAEAQERKRGGHPHGILIGSEWSKILSQSIKSTLVDRSWSTAFAENGMAASFESLRPRITDLVCVHFPLPPGPPDELDIETIVGRTRERLREQVLRASLRAAVQRTEALRLPAAARLPSAGPAASASTGAASSSSSARPPLPPPADLPPSHGGTARMTRSGSQY